MKTKQKRWKSEAEILRAIDTIRSTQRNLNIQGEQMETSAKDMIRRAALPSTPHGEACSLQSEGGRLLILSRAMLRKAANKEKAAKKMGDKLAAFRTAIIPNVVDDLAVV